MGSYFKVSLFYWRAFFWLRAAATVFQQREDFLLHCIDLAEWKIWVANDEEVAELTVLVNPEDPIRGSLGIGLTQDFFSLKHDREDIADIFRVVLVLFDETPQQFLRAFLFEGVLLLFGDRGTVFCLPLGERFFGFVAAFFPSLQAEVLAKVA